MKNEKDCSQLSTYITHHVMNTYGGVEVSGQLHAPAALPPAPIGQEAKRGATLCVCPVRWASTARSHVLVCYVQFDASVTKEFQTLKKIRILYRHNGLQSLQHATSRHVVLPSWWSLFQVYGMAEGKSVLVGGTKAEYLRVTEEYITLN
jgi:hypothetical protein